VSGRIVEFQASIGDMVKEGQELAALDPRDLQNAVAVAEAEKERSEALLERVKKAFESRAVAAQDVTNAEAQARAAAAALAIAQKQVSDAIIRAPFDGRIAATYVENFENVIAKQKVLRLLDASKIEMVIDVPESLIPNVPYVESIEVTFSTFPDLKIPATVKEVGSEASELTRTYPVTLIMDQPEGAKILPGMAGEAIGTANLPPERLAEGVPVLPSAIGSSGGDGGSFVWVIDEKTGAVSKRDVEVDRFSPAGLIVTQGLTPGEWVATAGVHSLKEGQRVRILDQG
ncbi:MAG: efflux RND transporter periplasmic adaptor subunit, partial [Verrucomicrobiales bacterium]